MNRKTVIYALFSFVLLSVQGFSVVDRKYLSGIWSLKLEHPSALGVKRDKEILINIQEDGSFQQCNDDSGGTNAKYDRNWLHGCWEFQENELKLALDRKSSMVSRDTLLAGRISGDDLAVKSGSIHTGKFMYPQNGFWRDFDNVMASSESCSTFSLQQTMGFYHMMMPASKELEKKPTSKFQPSHFYEKKFFMTIVPIESKVKPKQEWDTQRKEWRSPLDDQAADIRTVPIQFYANNTFEAIGINKVARGRFEITKDDKLWFRVSRFGTGRSTPGSVFSDGIGLSHEDGRAYLGVIQEEFKQGVGVNDALSKTFRVEGKVTFGADLGSDARPEPVGTFIMTEVDDTSLDKKDEDDIIAVAGHSSTGADDIFDSVFE